MNMTDEEFSNLVAEGIDALREDIRKRMKNVAIVIAEEPTEEQRRDHGLSPEETLFGLYEGVPQTERGIDDFLYPDKITIFKKPILAAYSDPRDVATCIQNTVWHEVAHHFGMDEDAVHAEEIQRNKTL
jgi:predicted Zn-dependent protease with MMP-like domain